MQKPNVIYQARPFDLNVVTLSCYLTASCSFEYPSIRTGTLDSYSCHLRGTIPFRTTYTTPNPDKLALQGDA